MKFLDSLSPHVHWGMRASIAATYLYHGSHKFPPTALVQNFGFPMWFAWIIAVTEIVAALCFLAGPFTKDLITRVGALLVVTNMIGAIAIVHNSAWDYRAGGMEFQILILAVATYFLVKGNEV